MFYNVNVFKSKEPCEACISEVQPKPACWTLLHLWFNYSRFWICVVVTEAEAGGKCFTGVEHSHLTKPTSDFPPIQSLSISFSQTFCISLFVSVSLLYKLWSSWTAQGQKLQSLLLNWPWLQVIVAVFLISWSHQKPVARKVTFTFHLHMKSSRYLIHSNPLPCISSTSAHRLACIQTAIVLKG